MTGAPPVSRETVTRRSVWHLAWPIMVANISIPLLGLADTAVIGNVGTTASLAAIAIGAQLFNMLFWGLGFLRMGTTGMVAQAYGADDGTELKAILARALLLAAAVSVLALAAQGAILAGALLLFAAEGEVAQMARTYFDIRIWGTPAVVATFALLGWFIGAQDSRPVLVLQLFLNITNIILNMVFVLGLKLDVAGVALGTLIAEWLTLGLAIWLFRRRMAGHFEGRAHARLTWTRIVDPAALLQTLAVNRDIFIRTALLISAFAWFTAIGSRLGPVTLAGNHVLMQFLAFSAFFLDGWAIAAEGLVGRAVGAKNRSTLNRTVRLSFELAVANAAALSLAFIALGPLVIRGLTDIETVRAAALAYLPFAALHPILGVWCFQFDGIFIGATRSRDMRNAMLVSFAAFALVWWAMQDFGNTGLWIAFLTLFAARGITLAARYPALARSIDAS